MATPRPNVQRLGRRGASRPRASSVLAVPHHTGYGLGLAHRVVDEVRLRREGDRVNRTVLVRRERRRAEERP